MAVVQYLYAGSGSPIAERRLGTTRVYQSNGLGSTRQLVDSGGSVTDTFEFDLLGNERSRTGSTATPYKWNVKSWIYSMPSGTTYRDRPFVGRGGFVSGWLQEWGTIGGFDFGGWPLGDSGFGDIWDIIQEIIGSGGIGSIIGQVVVGPPIVTSGGGDGTPGSVPPPPKPGVETGGSGDVTPPGGGTGPPIGGDNVGPPVRDDGTPGGGLGGGGGGTWGEPPNPAEDQELISACVSITIPIWVIEVGLEYCRWSYDPSCCPDGDWATVCWSLTGFGEYSLEVPGIDFFDDMDEIYDSILSLLGGLPAMINSNLNPTEACILKKNEGSFELCITGCIVVSSFSCCFGPTFDARSGATDWDFGCSGAIEYCGAPSLSISLEASLSACE